jgi:hypothetical protein
MISLDAFGLVAVRLLLLLYAIERRSRLYTLAFVFACGLGSAYAFLQGAWPFGLAEAAWSLVAVRLWWMVPRPSYLSPRGREGAGLDRIPTNVQ